MVFLDKVGGLFPILITFLNEQFSVIISLWAFGTIIICLTLIQLLCLLSTLWFWFRIVRGPKLKEWMCIILSWFHHRLMCLSELQFVRTVSIDLWPRNGTVGLAGIMPLESSGFAVSFFVN